MLKTEYSLFLGKTSDQFFSGFITENNLYLVVEIEGGTNQTGTMFLTILNERLRNTTVNSLDDLESAVRISVHMANLPLGVSVAAMYVHKNGAYLMTMGDARILLRRGKEVAEIIHDSSTASGHIQKDDLYILGTKRFTTLFSAKEGFNKLLIANDVFSVVDSIYEHIADADDSGITALFLSPLEAATELVSIPPSVMMEEGENTNIVTAKEESGFKFPKLPIHTSKKTLTLAVVAIIFAVLIWSVVLGYQRRTEAQLTEKIQKTKESVVSKMNEAEELYASNNTHSLELISEAKTEVRDLKTSAGDKKMAEVEAIDELVTQREDQITKKEEKSAQEFYDLSLDTKEAKANKIYMESDTTALLDKSKKTVYILSLAKKSLDKRTAAEVGQSSLIGLYEGSVYLFIHDKGIFTLSGANKLKKIINADKDWGTVVDMRIYSGNIYLLDTEKNDIYKYLVAENGYSTKQSYFKSDADIQNAKSISIDSALYIGMPDEVIKYNGGLPTNFRTKYPDESVSVEKVFTTEALQKVFVWDKDSGTVYVLGKTGEYEQQLHSSIMKTATDFAVSGDTIYFLSDSKIYTVKL
ncbi:MAG: hypothetical protein ABIO02_02465 [Patescibacteria group bacterium]